MDHEIRSYEELCIKKSQCESQECIDRTCHPRTHLTIHKPELFPIAYRADQLTAIVGELTPEEGSCSYHDEDIYPAKKFGLRKKLPNTHRISCSSIISLSFKGRVQLFSHFYFAKGTYIVYTTK